MMINKGLFSSASDNWETPQWLFDELNKEFNFTLDVAANISNHKCIDYFDEMDDGLIFNWHTHNNRPRKNIDKPGAIWMNPPYGRQIDKWIRKAYNEAKKGALVVCLLPARVDTRWFHEYIMKANEIRFIRGRLKFGNSKNSAPFPSMIVVFGKTIKKDIKSNLIITSYRKIL